MAHNSKFKMVALPVACRQHIVFQYDKKKRDYVPIGDIMYSKKDKMWYVDVRYIDLPKSLALFRLETAGPGPVENVELSDPFERQIIHGWIERRHKHTRLTLSAERARARSRNKKLRGLCCARRIDTHVSVG